MYNFKDKIEDYTEREFIELLGEFTNPTGDNAQLKGEELDKYWDDLEEHLTRITQHPLMSDLIYYPAKKGDDKPDNILKIVKEWRRSQGLPLFKDSE
ncbi:TPA: bacteriocin immunity protein [Escherichia coli]|nr:bacteriocin immunity protein [Escherichia coli]